MSEQPRLLFCCFDVLPGPTGLSRRITEYLKGLGDRFQVVVLSTKTPDHSHIERYHQARLLRVPVGAGDLPSRIQAFDRAVRRQLESEEYLLAHFFDPFGGYALCEARAQYGFRLVYEAQSFPSQDLRFTHPTLEGDRRFLSKVRRQELYCLMNADAVICGSEVTRAWVLSLGAPPMSLHVFRQPVEPGAYRPEVVGRPDGTPMKLLHLGSQLPFQGLETVLRALQLALRHADLRLLVVGPRPPDGQAPYDELVAQLKLTGKVEFLPPVAHDELPKTLALADVGLLALDGSERNEAPAGPLAKAAEYLAAGRPVVASDLPVTRELLPEGARRLFPPGDFKALAEVLVELAANARQRVAMGTAAREAASQFDAAATRGRLLDLYDTLSARGKASTAGETQGEVTQLRAAGSPDTGRGAARAEERPPSETVDDEPPVVVGDMLAEPKPPDPNVPTTITAPSAEAPVPLPTEHTPIVRQRKKTTSGVEEATPVGPPPQTGTEPTPITSARTRRAASKSRAAVPPPPAADDEFSDEVKTAQITAYKSEQVTNEAEPPPEVTDENPLPPAESARRPLRAPLVVSKPPAPLETTPLQMNPATPQIMPPALSLPPPPLPPPPMPAHAPGATPTPRTRLKSEGKGLRSPLAGGPTAPIEVRPAAARPPPDEPEEVSPDDIESVEEEVSPVSGVDPWLAQLLFGYSPSEALPFERHAPPTTTPGKES